MGITRVMGLAALTGVRGVTGACKVEKGPVKDKQVENGKKCGILLDQKPQKKQNILDKCMAPYDISKPMQL